uniref:Chitin-binding type-2 domain-containing protein n=1 Tax=Caenorhabditis tropicalis TaxID=1561998 RepID=A0A1I7TEE7_9PELO
MLFFLIIPVFLSIGGHSAPTKSYPVPNPTNGTCLYDGLTMADPFDDRAYYQCCQHLWFLKYCLDGFVFDKYKLICVPENEIPTLPTPTKKHNYQTTATPHHFISTKSPNENCEESMGQDGYKPNPQNCRTYFQCVHGKWQLRDCGPGTQWVQSILGCDYYNGIC